MHFPVLSAMLAATAVCADSDTANWGCSTSPTAPLPVTAPGYQAQFVLGGLINPRGLIFDTQGHLIVVQRNTSLLQLTIQDQGNCVRVAQQKTLLTDTDLSHGLELSQDGRTLYASSNSAMYSWDYDATNGKVSNKRTLITGMEGDEHVTRTLTLSCKSKKPTMIISRGSIANIDPTSSDKSSGHGQVKAFDLSSIGNAPADFTTTGLLLGWGLRNSVGVAEHPSTGGIWAVENSADQMIREGVDIHGTNPGEELNFLGYLSGSQAGSNYGYPICFAAWDPKSLPDNKNISVGTQFSVNNATATANDYICQTQKKAPRLTFDAHMAPLDIKFDSAGTIGYVSFHGSWDRDTPAGYKVAAINYKNGQPVEPPTSQHGLIDIVTNSNAQNCTPTPNGCFRPVGLAWDPKGRLWFSSDYTGEIYVVRVPK